MNEPMHILITGGCGFIGSFLADHLIACGHRVRLLDNLDPQVHPRGRPDYLNPQAEVVVADVRDRPAVDRALDGMDAVIHAAAAVGVAQSLYRVEHYVDVNVRGTATLLNAIIDRPRKSIQKILLLSSMTGYGEGAYRRKADGAVVRPRIRTEEDIRQHGWEPVDPQTGEALEPVGITEDAAVQARNVYALSKRHAEDLVLSLGEVYSLPVVVFRMFNVYGPRQSLANPYTGVLAIFLSRLLSGTAPTVYEDGKQSRDFVSVHDVARAALSALTRSDADGQIVNIGSGAARGIAECGRILAERVGRPELAPAVNGAFRAGDIRHCTANISKARKLLGYEPQTTWQAGLDELIEWSRHAGAVDRFDAAHRELVQRGLLRETTDGGSPSPPPPSSPEATA